MGLKNIQPWSIGSDEERWNGYLLSPDSAVLRNKLNIRDLSDLREAENDLLELRVAELRANPKIIAKTFDLPHLQSIHHYLFQDVYDWAGELRTVGLARDGGDSFAPPHSIYLPMEHVHQRIYESAFLVNIPRTELPFEIAYLYDYINFAHPFREGNGRSQREFFQQLIEKIGLRMNWALIDSTTLHSACHIARNEGDLKPLEKIIMLTLHVS
ncbi:Fic/DOC family protein [Aurantimicrobium minutum]|uniref:Fic/DOC family protein n=1 Tax=Aurantimicrobium minutum TaxID=708131 RepID=UPI003D66365B